MTCQSCGNKLPAGARYCIHCGADQALPTPIAVVAAAMGSRGRREAANAAHAEPLDGRYDSNERPVPLASRAAGVPACEGSPQPRLDHEDEDMPPVYASAPARHGLAVGLIVACLAVGVIGGTAAWWWYAVRERVANPSAAVEARPSAAPPATQAPPPPVEVAPAAALAAAPESGAGTGTSSAEAVRQAEPAGAPQPVEITPLPPQRAAPPRVAKGAPPVREPRAAAPGTEPAPPTSPRPAVAAAPGPPAAAISNRWARMDQDLSTCTREDFIARVVCSQRVRFRYCDGYWGKVPACPGNPTTERGQ